MAVYDRWHAKPAPGAQPCKEHSRGKVALYPGADHGKGDRWQVRWRDENGSQRKLNRPKKGGTKDEVDPEIYAEALDAQIQHQLNTGTYIDPAAGDAIFRDFAAQVIRDRTLDPSTRDRMVQRLELHVFPVIGDKSLKVLARRPSIIQGLIARLQKQGLKDSTVELVLTHVRTVLSVAVDDELIGRNPFRSSTVVVPSAVKTDPEAWPPEHVAGVRQALPARYQAMVDAGAGLGMRRGEVLAFSPDDVDWLRSVVTVRHQIKVLRTGPDPETGKYRQVRVLAPPKGGKTRTVELVEWAKIALAEHMRACPPVTVSLPWKTADGKPQKVRLFFSTGAGTPVSCDTLAYFWRKALFAAGIVAVPKKGERVDTSPYGFHSLRRFFATVLLSAGEDVKDVSLALGHASVQITMDRYWKYIPKKKSRMNEILGAALSAAPGKSAPNVPPAPQHAAAAQVRAANPD